MSSRSLNKVMLIGNLTRDPELRYTPQGTPVCTFGLATNRSWQPASGERQEETEFHRIVSWNKLAELCNELLFKGRKVFVDGRLQTRNWTSADGQERSTVEIVIDNMIVLDSKRRDDRAQEVQPQNYEQVDYVEAGPDEEIDTKEVKPAKAVKPKVVKKAASADDKKSVKEEAEEKVNPDDIPF